MAPTTMPFFKLLLMKQNNNKSETKAAQTPPATAPTTMSILELLQLLQMERCLGYPCQCQHIAMSERSSY